VNNKMALRADVEVGNEDGEDPAAWLLALSRSTKRIKRDEEAVETVEGDELKHEGEGDNALVDLWVECTRCQVWVRVPCGTDVDGLPDDWTCDMPPSHNNPCQLR